VNGGGGGGTKGRKSAEQGAVVLRSRENQGGHELRDQVDLDGQPLVAHHYVHHLAQTGAVLLRHVGKMLVSLSKSGTFCRLCMPTHALLL